MVNGLVGTLDELCSGLSTKIYIENPDINLSSYSDLSVVKILKDNYENLLATTGVDNKTIYIVSSNVIDSYGQKIVNVQDATDLSDAINLRQLRSTISAENMWKAGDAVDSAKRKITS